MTLRGVAKANAARTHCARKGHLLDEANTFITTSGARRCKLCKQEYERWYWKKRRDHVNRGKRVGKL